MKLPCCSSWLRMNQALLFVQYPALTLHEEATHHGAEGAEST